MRARRRVGLIGAGPLPDGQTRLTGFPQLRVAAFREALIKAGHQVDTVLLEADERRQVQQQPGVLTVCEVAPHWRQTAADHLAEADVIVGAGPFRPGEVAVSLAGDRPILVDLPGDPLAELQAWAIAHQRPPDPTRLAAALDALAQVLGRADAITVISGPQRLAVLGQLGMTGRLAGPATTPFPVLVVPVGLPAGPAPSGSERPPTIVVAGGLNPWFDVETAVAACERALARRPDVNLTWAGGAIPGLEAPGWDLVVSLAARWPGRVDLPGWTPEASLYRTIDDATVGLCLDREGLEPLFGSRTRLLLYAARGVMPVATAGCELAQELAHAGLLRVVPVGDVDAVTEMLLLPPPDRRTRERLRAWVLERHSILGSTEPLVAWVAAAARAPRVAAEVNASLSAEVERLRRQLADVHQSPTWRWLDRVNRRLTGRK